MYLRVWGHTLDCGKGDKIFPMINKCDKRFAHDTLPLPFGGELPASYGKHPTYKPSSLVPRPSPQRLLLAVPYMICLHKISGVEPENKATNLPCPNTVSMNLTVHNWPKIAPHTLYSHKMSNLLFFTPTSSRTH